MEHPWLANTIAGLALLASIAALWLGARANRQANATQRRLLEIEEQRDKERRADATRANLRAELRDLGDYDRRLYIINDGFAAARDVEITLEGVPLGECEIAYQGSPGTVIGPRTEASCPLAIHDGCQPPFEILITWQDDSGEPREYRSTLTF
jgi:hypothetical protein